MKRERTKQGKANQREKRIFYLYTVASTSITSGMENPKHKTNRSKTGRKAT